MMGDQTLSYFPEDGVAGELIVFSAFQACFLLRWPQSADISGHSCVLYPRWMVHSRQFWIPTCIHVHVQVQICIIRSVCTMCSKLYTCNAYMFERAGQTFLSPSDIDIWLLDNGALYKVDL